jgi:hypothetical protein
MAIQCSKIIKKNWNISSHAAKMAIILCKLSVAMLPTWSSHSALGVDKLASLLENLFLVGIHHYTKLVNQRSKDVHHSSRMVLEFGKLAFCISCN